MAVAYFITFTTYGTWLHGTSKGQGSVDTQHNTYGSDFLAANSNRKKLVSDAMGEEPYTLDAPRRNIVRDAIVELARENHWQLLAAHVRSNHVHVVVKADRDPGRLMSDLKARASRELARAGFDHSIKRRWTRHGSTIHLFDESSIEQKIKYTLHQQGHSMAWFDGRNADSLRTSSQKEPRTQ